MNILLLQEYVDAALAEIGVRNHGTGRVKVRLDKTDPINKAWVRVHELADVVKFASHLVLLAHRQKWCVTINGTHRYLKVTTT
jgi:hypothetical protein